MAKRRNKKKERGVFLTTLVILSGFSQIFLMILFWRFDYLASFISGIGFLLGVWRWQRWSVYIFFVLLTFELIELPTLVSWSAGSPPFFPSDVMQMKTVIFVTFLF